MDFVHCCIFSLPDKNNAQAVLLNVTFHLLTFIGLIS